MSAGIMLGGCVLILQAGPGYTAVGGDLNETEVPEFLDFIHGVEGERSATGGREDGPVVDQVALTAPQDFAVRGPAGGEDEVVDAVEDQRVDFLQVTRNPDVISAPRRSARSGEGLSVGVVRSSKVDCNVDVLELVVLATLVRIHHQGDGEIAKDLFIVPPRVEGRQGGFHAGNAVLRVVEQRLDEGLAILLHQIQLEQVGNTVVGQDFQRTLIAPGHQRVFGPVGDIDNVAVGVTVAYQELSQVGHALVDPALFIGVIVVVQQVLVLVGEDAFIQVRAGSVITNPVLPVVGVNIHDIAVKVLFVQTPVEAGDVVGEGRIVVVVVA